MSSLLLVFSVFEGMCGFVLPICNAFSKPASSVKRYYYEDFLIVQYCISILALCYLQAIIFYYDQKENLQNKYRQKFHRELKKLSRSFPDEAIVNDTPVAPCATLSTLGYIESVKPERLSYSGSQLEMRATTTDSSNRLTFPAKQTRSANVEKNYHRFTRMPPYMPKVTFTLSQATTSNNIATPIPSSTQYIVKVDSIPVDFDQATDDRMNRLNASEVPEPTTSERCTQDESSESQEIVNHSTDGPVLNRFDSLVPLQFLFGDHPERHIRNGSFFSRDSEGVNLYLRLGAVGFGFGVMIFDGFKIAEPWEAPMNDADVCHSHLWIPVHFLHFVYVFWQTYFLFKHHQVVFNVQKFVLRFLLCHLAVANLCQWLKTIVDEISGEPHAPETIANNHSMEQPISTLIPPFNQVVSEFGPSHFTPGHRIKPRSVGELIGHPTGRCVSTAKYLAPFLFPCAIEYSLIAGAIFYKMFQKVGQVRKEFERRERMRQANTVTGKFSECHRSHKGLFIGLLLFMATLVTMCLFFIFFVKQDKRNTAITLYQSTELILLALSTITCVATMIRFRVLKLSNLSEEGAFDDNLLLVGLIGMIFYDLFLLVPALEAVQSGRATAMLFAAKAILEMLQSMVQVFFILEASRRCAGTVEHVRRKPGRTLITFLLILNLAMWFVNTFEVKRADHNSIHVDYYTEMAWKIITHIALPMIVFFRFHSTVCLSDIWANAYRFRTD